MDVNIICLLSPELKPIALVSGKKKKKKKVSYTPEAMLSLISLQL